MITTNNKNTWKSYAATSFIFCHILDISRIAVMFLQFVFQSQELVETFSVWADMSLPPTGVNVCWFAFISFFNIFMEYNLYQLMA